MMEFEKLLALTRVAPMNHCKIRELLWSCHDLPNLRARLGGESCSRCLHKRGSAENAETQERSSFRAGPSIYKKTDPKG